jgi:hypothetical protein
MWHHLFSKRQLAALGLMSDKEKMLLSVIKRSTCRLKSASEAENQKANTALCTEN